MVETNDFTKSNKVKNAHEEGGVLLLSLKPKDAVYNGNTVKLNSVLNPRGCFLVANLFSCSDHRNNSQIIRHFTCLL